MAVSTVKEEGSNGENNYRRKREKNNQAVKRSRVKSRIRVQQTVQRVNRLRAENNVLEEQVKLLSNELRFLKDLFMAHAGIIKIEPSDSIDIIPLLMSDTTSEILDNDETKSQSSS